MHDVVVASNQRVQVVSTKELGVKYRNLVQASQARLSQRRKRSELNLAPKHKRMDLELEFGQVKYQEIDTSSNLPNSYQQLEIVGCTIENYPTLS